MICVAGGAFLLIYAIYEVFWRGRGGDWLVSVFQEIWKVDHHNALMMYQRIFRNNEGLMWAIALIVLFLVMSRTVLTWITHYFDLVTNGIDALLSDDTEILMPPEMSALERKLRVVKSELKQRALEARLAEQRKNDLVMYLAHDIRTPLTSVIGYLTLLDEAPDMPVEQKAKYVNIALDKAYRLEKMVDEFFEITRYNLQQIDIQKKPLDLYYMLIQISDELLPALSENGNTVRLDVTEDLTVDGDPNKLARVFNNILRNAAAYSYPNTEIRISAVKEDDTVQIEFSNDGDTIPKEKLAILFEKFYRLDAARNSNTGGAGLGLAIAKEIVSLHGGALTAKSDHNTITFHIELPCGDSGKMNEIIGLS